jgi:hypothetical protein
VPLLNPKHSPSGTEFVNQYINNIHKPDPAMSILNLTMMLCALCNQSFTGSNFNQNNQIQEDSLKIIEKVYLQIDREKYTPGDDIWFKAYLIDATEKLLTNHSSNLYVELISPDSKIIDKRIVRMEDGLGNGDFRLAEKLQSGQYHLRAYTYYMRNFSDQLFFKKNITIINPSDRGNSFSDSVKLINNKTEITFFPEGGSLVDNVPSVVAFKAVNAAGEGCDVAGEVYCTTGELVTTFKSKHKGMGVFSLTPLSGLNYYAIVMNQNGESVRSEIMKSFQTGFTINLSKNNSSGMEVIIRTNQETLPLFTDQDLELAVSVHGIPFKAVAFRMRSVNSYLKLPTDDLPDGIVMLTLIDRDSKPLCERLVYIQNNNDISVNIETSKTEYNQRDSVAVKISLSENPGNSQGTFLSLSAIDVVSANESSPYPSTISSWFLLESDVHGEVEDPSYYFDPANPSRLQDLDLLLLTQGWRDFAWKYGNMVFPPEHGITISGRVRKKFANVPLENASVTIGIFKNEKSFIRSVPVDSSGRFGLKGVDLTGSAKLIASVTGDKDKLKGWLLLDSAGYRPEEVRGKIVRTKLLSDTNQDLPIDTIKENLYTYIQYSEIKRSIQKKYKLSDTINVGEVTITAKRQDLPESARARSQRYLRTLWPDREYEVTEISKVYNNVGTLLTNRFMIRPPKYFKPKLDTRNMVGGSEVSGAGGSSGSSPMANVASQSNNVPSGGGGPNGPIIMLNGMEVGWEGVESLPIDWIERVDYIRPVTAELSWGVRGKAGVVSVVMQSGAPTDIYIPAFHSVNIRFSGYNEPRIFYSPKHHSTLLSDYKPDLRTTLFWEPDIRLENNKEIILNYYNADNSSVIKITVEGITSSGIPVTGKTEYVVK